MTEQQKGFWVAMATNSFWGVAPIFFKWLKDIDALQTLSHRVVWGMMFILLFLIIRDRGQLWQRAKVTGKQFLGLLLSSALIATNWLVFIWAVNHDQILATSFGYFINPLVQN